MLRCVELGLVGLDWPISRVLKVPADKQSITVRQLLSHTSGLAQGDAGEVAPSAAAAARAVLQYPLEAAPGARFIYSNGNYFLAAAIVERVSRTAFTSFVRRQLLDPAGSKDTGQAIGGSANAHVSPLPGIEPPRLSRPRWLASGFYSTAGDLRRWLLALLQSRVLRAESVAALFQPVARTQEASSALGWFVAKSQAGTDTIFTRGNDDFGPNSLIYFYPRSQTLIVVLTHAGDENEDRSWSRSVHADIEAVLGL